MNFFDHQSDHEYQTRHGDWSFQDVLSGRQDPILSVQKVEKCDRILSIRRVSADEINNFGRIHIVRSGRV